MGIYTRIRDYFSKWLERKIVDPLYEKISARIEARVTEDEKRLEASVEALKANAKADLAAVVGSASAGLNNDFQNLKGNFSILNSQFDKFVKDVDSKIAEFIEVNASKVDNAVSAVNFSVHTSAGNVSTAVASYEAARTALEEMRKTFESTRTELLDSQTQYGLDYAAFQAAAKSVQESIIGLEKRVNDWSTRAHELLSVDLTAERLERAQENGSKLLKSINDAKAGIKYDILAVVKDDVSAQLASVSKELTMKLQEIADERAYNLMVYALGIPENRRGIVCWVADYNGNYETVRTQLKDGSARGWLTLFEKDVKDKNMNLKYLASIVKLIGYRQKNLKPS